MGVDLDQLSAGVPVGQPEESVQVFVQVVVQVQGCCRLYHSHLMDSFWERALHRLVLPVPGGPWSRTTLQIIVVRPGEVTGCSTTTVVSDSGQESDSLPKYF